MKRNSSPKEKKTKKNTFLENLITGLPGHVYWLDTHNVYLGCNNLQAHSFGLSSPDDIVGKTNYDFLPKKTADMVNGNNDRVMKTGVPYVGEEKATLPNRSTAVYISHKVPLYDETGKLLGMLGISFDITDYKKEEKRLKVEKTQAEVTLENIIAIMPGHVYWKDLKGAYLGCNDHQAQSLGLSSRKDILGKTDYDLSPKDKADAFRKIDKTVIATKEPHTIEEIIVLPNGNEATVLSQKVPLVDNHKDIVGVLGVSFDITQQKMAELALIKAKEAAEASNQLKTEFIHNMEHDIRTPFVGIWGIINLLAKKEEDPGKKELLEQVSLCAKELLDYCNSILDFSKIDAREIPVLSKKFELSKLVQSITAMEAPAAELGKLDFNVKYDDTIPVVIMGDEHRLKRVLINLLSNAIKFTEKGYVKLQIKTVKHTARSIIIQFVVSDSGIGIPKEKQDIIYEKFTRIIPSNKGMYQGSGLGLRIVKQFVEEMEGDIEVHSEEEKGTTFICTLPFKLPLA